MDKKKTVFAEVDLEAVRRQYADEVLRGIHDSEVVDRLAELTKAVQAVKKRRPRKRK